MKKRLCSLFFSLLLVFASPLVVRASDLMEDLKSQIGLESIEDALPPTFPERDTYYERLGKENPSGEDVLSAVFSRALDSFRGAVGGELTLLCTLLCILIIGAYFSSMRHSWMRDSLGDAFDFLCVMALAAVSYHALFSLFSSVRETLASLCNFVGLMLPVTGAVYSLSGAGVTATAQKTVLLAALSLFQSINLSYLFPLLSASFVLASANAVSALPFGSFSAFLRRCVSFFVGAVFLIFLFVLSIQTVLGAAGDSFALRSARYAAANFIPAIGGMFSESAKTLFSAISVLRTSLGGMILCVILWIVLVPIVQLLVRRAVFSVLSSLSGMFSLERESRFFSECAQTCGLCLSVCVSGGVFFLLSFSVFLSVNVGG